VYWRLREQQASADIQFTDVTTVRSRDTGESYGAAWGDYNGDGLPDCDVNHHRNAMALT
jgi:hypothetical protein